MAKKNLLIEGPFGSIIDNNDHLNFVLIDDALGTNVSPELKKCTDLYARLIFKNKDDFETLAKLEETINKLRCKEVAKKEFKLSQTRGYIYARTPFFRNGKDIKDIRTVVGKTSEYGDDLDILFADKAFVLQAKDKLQTAITEQIKLNMTYINELEEKFQCKCETNQ